MSTLKSKNEQVTTHISTTINSDTYSHPSIQNNAPKFTSKDLNPQGNNSQML